MEQLPAVAKSFSTECKKCGEERYHRVLTHLTATSAKIECEICHSKKTFKLGAKAAPKKAAGPTKTALKKAAQAEATLKAHSDEYEKLLAAADPAGATYKISVKFQAQQKIEHPKFGVGVVRTALPDRIEVVFADEVRNLVHNRT